MWANIVALILKLIDKIPIQGKRERWRNELARLKKEKKALLQGAADAKKARRVLVIERRIAYLNQLLQNSD